MALITCIECGRENISDTAMACPNCGFGIREYFNNIEVQQVQEKQLEIDIVLSEIRDKLDEFYIREGAYWYRIDKNTFNFFNRNALMTNLEAEQCNNPGLGSYEFINYLEKQINDFYFKCLKIEHGGKKIYNNFIIAISSMLIKDKYNCFWSYGSQLHFYKSVHIDYLERNTILCLARQTASGNYSIWSAGELKTLSKNLNDSEKMLCISFLGSKYNPKLTENIDIDNLYKKWLEYKIRNEEFTSNIIDQFRCPNKMIMPDKEDIDNMFPEKIDRNVPKCLTCGSINIEKISIGKKAFGSIMFGLLSSDVRKTMHCKDCGYKW